MQQKLLFYFIIFTPIVDTVNGIFINYGISIPIGNLYRFLLIIFLMNAIFLERNEVYSKNKIISLKIIWVYMVICYFLLNAFTHYFTNQDVIGLFSNLEFNSRLILFVLMIYGSVNIIKNNPDLVIKAINYSSWIVPLTIFVPYLMGYGNNTYFNEYGVPVGYKGFYFSNNSLSVVLIILFIFCIDSLFSEKVKVFNVIRAVFVFLSLILIGAKSGIFFSILIFFIYIFLSVKKIKYVVINLTMMVIGSIIMYILYNKQIDSIIDRQLSSFENNNLLTYLLSGRNEFFMLAFEIFNSKLTVFTLFFGQGFANMTNLLGLHLYGSIYLNKGVEMDLFDIYFNVGLIGLLIILIIFGSSIFRSIYYLWSEKTGIKPYFFSLIVLIIFTILGGHVVTEAFSITFFGIVIAVILSKSQKKECFKC